MSSPPPVQLILGPDGHGVVEYAADVAAAVRRTHPDAPVLRAEDAREAHALTAGASRMHVHVTDRLWGPTPEAAADTLEDLAGAIALSVTLHDVPQPSDGTGLPRRRDAYRRVIDAADRVAVNSDHEAALLVEHLDRRADAVIPLGVRRSVAPDVSTSTWNTDGELVVLIAGFIYPGKGHAVAIEAAARAAASLRERGRTVSRVVVRAIGRPSPGHERDVDALAARGREVGVDVEVTGFLSDADFARRIGGPGIPLAAHEHLSASRSMLDWIEAGRRPLVVRSRYAEETAALRPGTLALYDAEALADELATRWADPSLTRLAAGVPLGPSIADAAAAYTAWWRA